MMVSYAAAMSVPYRYGPAAALARSSSSSSSSSSEGRRGKAELVRGGRLKDTRATFSSVASSSSASSAPSAWGCRRSGGAIGYGTAQAGRSGREVGGGEDVVAPGAGGENISSGDVMSLEDVSSGGGGSGSGGDEGSWGWGGGGDDEEDYGKKLLPVE